MDKYQFTEQELQKLDIRIYDEVYITEEEKIKEYDELVSNGKTLPEGIKKEVWKEEEQNGEVAIKYNYLKVVPLTNEQISAQLEIKNTMFLQSISSGVNFFVALVVIGFFLSILFILFV